MSEHRSLADFALQPRSLADKRGSHHLFVYADLLFGGGTFAPSRRASDNPIAIACLGFVTLRPLPERNFPRLNSCISSPTFSDAFGP